MGARNGVMAVTMVEAGMTGVPDVLDGTHNLFVALSTKPDPEAMVAGLGSLFYVAESAIKTFSVGYPNQSALDALLQLRKQYGLTPANVQSILVKLPTDAIGIVGNSAMADVNCQHLVALALLKGAVSFNDSHDASLMKDPGRAGHPQERAAGGRRRADGSGGAARRHRAGDSWPTAARVEHHTRFPPGTKENPLSTEAVNAKTRDLMAPVLGAAKTERLIGQINEPGETRRHPAAAGQHHDLTPGRA